MLTFSENRPVVAAALLQVQKSVVPIVKDSINPHFKNKYASLGAVTDVLRPILTANGFSLLQSVGQSAGTLTITTTLLHESGEWVRNEVAVPMGEKATPQTAGSAITYGRRYGLSALLAITTDDDDDGQRGSAQRRAAVKESQQSADLNARRATSFGDVLFPALAGFEQYKGHKLADVPTDVLAVCYERASARTDKKAKQIASAAEAVLEDRRTGE